MDDDEHLQCTTSNRITKSGRRAGPVIHNDFAYYKLNTLLNGSTYYYCAKRKSYACHARLTITTDGERRASGKHNHGVDPSQISAIKVKNDMYHKGASGMSVREIVVQSHQSLDMGTLSRLPKPESSVRFLNRVRARHGKARVEEPKELDKVQIPAELTMLHDEQLLKYDSGAADPERFFMITSNKLLTYLASSKVWLIDGTFHVPDYFRQLWVVHATFMGGAVPCAFFLLPSKSTAMYRRALAVLKEKCPDMKPEVVIVDFELAERNALRLEYGVSTYGCWFHLSQSIMRKSTALELQFHYLCNYEQQQYTRALWALTMVPIEDVPVVFELLKEKALSEIYVKTPEVVQPFTELYNYFHRNYIGDSASFPPSTWNWFDWAKTCPYRSTSEAESWHRQLNNKLGALKTGIGLLNDIIPALKAEIGISETRGLQKQVDKKKRHTILDTKEERISNLMKTYDTGLSEEAKLTYLLNMVELMIALSE